MLRSQLRNGEDVFDLIAEIVIARQADWRKQAACRDLSTAVFFNTNGQPSDEYAAKQVCNSCGVKNDCRKDWEDMPPAVQGHGVWWGTLPRERKGMRPHRA
jgi:hypothetical protein